MAKTTKDIFDLQELASLLDLPKFDDFEFDDTSYGQGYDAAIEEGKTEDEAMEQGVKWEEGEQKEVFRKYRNAVEHVAEQIFDQHGLIIVEEKKTLPKSKGGGSYSLYKVAPEKSWDEAVNRILETINGVGMFEFNSRREFIDSGPYKSSKDAVLQHLHWMKRRPEVYGDTRPRRMFDRQMGD